MQISFKPTRRNKSAYALLMVMCFLTASLLVFASLMYWVSSNAKVTMSNEQFMASEYAAEAAVENALTYMNRDFLSQSLQTNYYYKLLPPTNGWPVNYTFSDTNGVANQISVFYTQPPALMTNLGTSYANLYGLPQNCLITATATPIGQAYNVPATVSLGFQAASIPVFQFAIFYNVDLDMAPGQAMTIGGKTFSNGNIWFDSGAQVTFNDTVTCAGTFNLHSDPNGDQTANVKASPTTPIYNFTGNGGQPLSHADAIVLPIGANCMTNNNATNVEAILQVPPPAYAPGTAAAYSTNGLVYCLNSADLIISNTAAAATIGTNITVYYQNQNLVGGPFQLVSPDITNKYPTGTNISGILTNIVSIHTNNTNPKTYNTNYSYNTNFSYTYATNYYFSFVTNDFFYDFRQSATSYVIQLDVALLNTWFSNATLTGGSNYNVYNNSATSSTTKNHYVNGVYIYNYIPLTSSQMPAVRVLNGAQLPPGGLTIATPMPLYVQGDYNVQLAGGTAYASAGTHNTANTYPAAFMADAITVLSSAWNDTGGAWMKGGSEGSRGASNTTINAACIEGVVLS
jgi:hypothetical protein